MESNRWLIERYCRVFVVVGLRTLYWWSLLLCLYRSLLLLLLLLGFLGREFE